MSRRKQSNPKPLKRRSEDELEELARSHQLPLDILQVREVEEEGSTGDVGVFTPYPLAKGSCIFGPFKVKEVKMRQDNQEELTDEQEEMEKEQQMQGQLQFSWEEEDKMTVNIQNEGRWLNLIREAGKSEENVTICLQGKSLVWCEITQDIKEDTELLAIYKREPDSQAADSSVQRVDEATHSGSPAHSNPALLSPSPALSATTEDSLSSPAPTMVVKGILRPGTPGITRPEGSTSPTDRKASPDQETSPQPTRFPLIYGCVHCGVKFSNPRTLAAHVEFYCSKKPLPSDSALSSVESATVEHMDVDRLSQKSDENIYKPRSGIEAQMMAQLKEEQLSPTSRRRSDSDRSATSTPKDKSGHRISSDESPDAPASKVAKTGHTFQCPFCSYSSDKKISLNRHLRMHNGTDDSSRSQPTTPDIDEQQGMSQENFCKECNIQFSSRKTFVGHKEYYCATRRKRHLSTGTMEGTSPPPAVITPAEVDIHQQMPYLPSQAAAYAVQSFLRSPAVSQAVGNILGQQPAIVVAAPMITPSTISSISTPTVILQPVIALPSNMSAGRHNPMLPQSIPSSGSTPTPVSPAGTIPAPSTHHTGTPSQSHPINPQGKGDQPLDLSCKKESPRAKSLLVEPEKTKTPPLYEQKHHKEAHGEPQDLSVKRESRTPSAERSPQPVSPAGREPSLGSRTPDRPPEGVPVIPPQTAEILAAQAQMYMMNQQAAAAAAMLYAPPNISKCLECNIVFYKHENYLIHKEHYCAGRRISKRERLLAKELSPNRPVHIPHMEHSVQNGIINNEAKSPRRSQSSSPKQASPPTLSPPSLANKTEVPLDQSFLQVYCIPCKIKFSSTDTLTAHQQFYCPFNKENHLENGRNLQTSPTAAAPDTDSAAGSRPDSGSGSETMDSEGSVHTCPNCGHNFPSYRLLKLHFCKASSMHIPLLRCPYCDFITQSDNRLVEHIKGHAPTKAYRCTICGYRGNTVRGMRMHGKTHVDEGQTFSDENMVEYEEPPLIPKRNHSTVVESNPVDMEAELIRLKNEPYKRRRSRKGYEKAENMSPLRRQPPHICMTCNEVFSDTVKLRQHMRVHMQEATYACRSCELVTNDKASLVRHVKRVHESHSRSSLDSNADGNLEMQDSTSRNTDSSESDMSVKHEPVDESHESRQKAVKDDPTEHQPPSGTASDYLSQRSPPPESEVQSQSEKNGENSNDLITIKQESSSESDVNQNRHCHSNKSAGSPSPSQLSMIDSENAISKSPPISLATNTSTVASYSSSAPSAPTTPRPSTTSPLPLPVNGKTEMTPTEILLQKKEEKNGMTYCHQCDIPFVYMSSFMAHKKYYCNSHAGERENNRTEVS